MPVKPDTPITRKEMYLDVATGGSLQLPSPVTREEKYLAKIAGESVDIPTPVTRYEMLLAAVTGESYTLTPATRLEVYLAKAAGQDVDVPQPITREEMYWFDYVGGQPTPSEQEYTGAVPVTFIANGQPLLDYLISGNTVQNGTPTPDNPIQPQECGERTGNLATSVDATTSNNIYIHADKSEMASNTPYSVSFYSDVTFRGNSVYLNTYNPSYSRLIGTISGSGQVSSAFSLTDSDISAIDNASQFSIRVYKAETDFSNTKNIMLNIGSTALPYEPYGYKIPISSANTTTPIYLGEVESTRQIKKLVLTGEENFILKDRPDTANYMYVLRLYHKNTIGVCSHLPYTDSYPRTFPGFRTDASMQLMYMCIGPELQEAQPGGNTVEGFRYYLAQQYAAGTPVTIWYVLESEETAVVNEPLMKIGEYADTLSMEQAGVEIPTVNGSNTLDVDTTVKPSEVYIKYKGEPIVGSQTSSQSSAYAPAEVSSQSENVDDINNSLLGKEEETE